MSSALLQLPLWSDAAVDHGWRVRRSVRARRLSVRVFRDGGVEIIAPPRVSPPQISDFVTRHRQWIERQLRATPVDASFPPLRLELAALDAGGRNWAYAELPPRARATPAALLYWLTERAAEHLEPLVAEVAALMGVSYRRVQIRRQRTRWGSCSTRGTRSLNCCLLFQRPAVVRYLVIHELAHVTHMNHSERFWRHVERFEPQWRALDAELTRGWSQVPGWVLAALRT